MAEKRLSRHYDNRVVNTHFGAARTSRIDAAVHQPTETRKIDIVDGTRDTRNDTRKVGRNDGTRDTRNDTRNVGRNDGTRDTRNDTRNVGRNEGTRDTRNDTRNVGRNEGTRDTRIDKPESGIVDTTLDTRNDHSGSERTKTIIDEHLTKGQYNDIKRVSRTDYTSTNNRIYSEFHKNAQRDDSHDYNTRHRNDIHSESVSKRNEYERSSEFNEYFKQYPRQHRNSSQKSTERIRSHSNDASRYNNNVGCLVSVDEFNIRKSSSNVQYGNRKAFHDTHDKTSHHSDIQDEDFSSAKYKRSQRPHTEHRTDYKENRSDKRNRNEINNSRERSKQKSSLSDYEIRDKHREQEDTYISQQLMERNRNHVGRESVHRRSSYRDSSYEPPTSRQRSSSASRNWENRNELCNGTVQNMRKEDRRYDLNGETAHGKPHSKSRSASKQNLNESFYRETNQRYPFQVSTSNSTHVSDQGQCLAQPDSQIRISPKLQFDEAVLKNNMKPSLLVSNNRSEYLTNYSGKETYIHQSESQKDEKQTLEPLEQVCKRRNNSVDNANRSHRIHQTASMNVIHQNMSPGNRRRSYNDEQEEFSSSLYNQNIGITRRCSQSNMDSSIDPPPNISSRHHNYQIASSANISPPHHSSQTSFPSQEEDFRKQGKSPKRTVSQSGDFRVQINREQLMSSSGTGNSSGIVNCSFEEGLKNNMPAVNGNKHNTEEQHQEATHCSSDTTVPTNFYGFENNLEDSTLNYHRLSDAAVKESLVLPGNTNGSSFGLAKDKDCIKSSSRGHVLADMENSTSSSRSGNDKTKSLLSDGISYFLGKSNKDQQLQTNPLSGDIFSLSERWRKLKQGITHETDPSFSDSVAGKDAAAALLQSAATKIVNSFNSFTGMQIALPKSASSSSTPPAKNIPTNISTCNIPTNESMASLAKTENSVSTKIKSDIIVDSKVEVIASVSSKTDHVPSISIKTSTELPLDTFSGRPSTISTNGNLSTHNKRFNVYAKMAEKIDSPDSEKSGEMTPPKLETEMKRRGKEANSEFTSFLPAQMSRREEKFHEAARVNDASAIRQLLKERVNVNCRNNLDRTALHWAAANGNLEATEALIENAADVDAKDKYGMRSVLWAAWFGHISILKALVNAGANTRVTNKQGLSMLHCASENNHLAVISFAFEALEPHDVNQRDKNDRTPLHLAAEGGHVEAVKRLLEAKADLHRKDKGGMTAVHLAAKHGHVEVLKALLLQGVEVDDIDVDGKTALHLAAESGHKESVDLLLDYTANPNSETVKEATPLHLAAQEGHLEVCRSLVKYGSNVNAQNFQGNSALHIAATGDHKEVARILIDAKCELDLPNSSAARRDKRAFIDNLATEAEKASKRMLTPLHAAIESGHLEVVQVLLAGGASLDTREKSGKSALQLAARGNYVEVVDMLIKAERYYANAREYHDKDVGYLDPDTYLRNPQHPKAPQMKDAIEKLAMKQLKPADWKKLAFHWHFTPEHVKAIEQEYTGATSYREHGYRLLDIWLHGVRKDENVLKLLTEALVAIDRKHLAVFCNLCYLMRDDIVNYLSSRKCVNERKLPRRETMFSFLQCFLKFLDLV